MKDPESEAVKLSSELLEKAKKLEVNFISLFFQGGNDEGYLFVECSNKESPWQDEDKGEARRVEIQSLADDVEKWAWDNYSYSGAGEGIDYGNNIEYDLQKNTATLSGWHHAPVNTEGGSIDFNE